MNFWFKFFWLFTIVVFFYPAATILGLDSHVGGVIVVAQKVLLACCVAIFFIYPFFRGYASFKEKEKAMALIYIAAGIVVPVLSGLMLVFVLEVINFKQRK